MRDVASRGPESEQVDGTVARGGVGKQTLTEQLPESGAAPRGPSALGQAVAWVPGWVQSLLTAPALAAARGEVTAAPADPSASIAGHPIPLTEELRTWLLDQLRRQAMARVVAVRAPLRPLLGAAPDATARRQVQDQMRTAARPFLDEIRASPGARFEAEPAVQDEVLAALTLDGEGHAEDELAAQTAGGASGADGPRARARAAGHLPTGAWCGAFAYASQESAGLSSNARTAMQYTGPGGGIDEFLDYGHAGEVVWTGSEWQLTRAYHTARGSQRRLTRTPRAPEAITPGSVAAPTGLDIRPGDIVLIDNARGTFADHITQCRSYNPATGALETIAGNEGGGQGHVAASRQPRDLNANPAAETVGDGESKPSRVYAYGRFSIVDYESHTYLPAMPRDPSQSPEAMAAAAPARH